MKILRSNWHLVWVIVSNVLCRFGYLEVNHSNPSENFYLGVLKPKSVLVEMKMYRKKQKILIDWLSENPDSDENEIRVTKHGTIV